MYFYWTLNIHRKDCITPEEILPKMAATVFLMSNTHLRKSCWHSTWVVGHTSSLLSPGRNLCDGLDQQVQGSDATGLARLWSWTYHTCLPCSLERFHPGTQPPRGEEAQATRKGHCRCSQPQLDPPGRCLQIMPAPSLHVVPDKDQMTWNWDQLFPVPCLDSWLTGSLSTMYFSFQPLTCGMVYFSLTML